MGALANAQGTMNNLTFGNEHVPVLRDDLLGLAGRPDERRPRLRRHVRRPHPHDQFAPDRPGSAGTALSRCCSRISTSARAPAARANGTPATAPSAPSASSKRWNARSCRRTATARRKASTAAATARSARPRSAATTAAIETLKACDQTVLEAGEAVIVTTPTPGGIWPQPALSRRADMHGSQQAVTGLSSAAALPACEKQMGKSACHDRRFREIWFFAVARKLEKPSTRTARCRRPASRSGCSPSCFPASSIRRSGKTPMSTWRPWQLGQGHRVVTIASGGCNMLAYLTRSPARDRRRRSQRRPYRAEPPEARGGQASAAQADLFRFFGDAEHQPQFGSL